jgi:hypothetical protein
MLLVTQLMALSLPASFNLQLALWGVTVGGDG